MIDIKGSSYTQITNTKNNYGVFRHRKDKSRMLPTIYKKWTNPFKNRLSKIKWKYTTSENWNCLKCIKEVKVVIRAFQNVSYRPTWSHWWILLKFKE